MVRNSRHASGFTLLEIIIVVVLIVAFAAYSLGVYRDYQQRAQLTGESAKLTQTLQLARKKASASEKPCAAFTGKYTVSWNTASYTLTPDGCPAQKSYTLPTGISLLSTGSVVFKAFALGVETSQTVTVKNNTLQKCRSIAIGNSGSVSEAEVVCP